MKKHPSLALTLTIATLLLAGCTLGPNYVRPEAAVPAAWKTEVPWKEAAPADHLTKGAWWEIYGDPVLNRLQEEVATANQELRAALARVDQARALARISEADRAPRLDLDPTAARGRNGTGLTGNAFRVPLDLGYEIDLWGRVRRSVEAAGADYAASAAEYENVRLTLHAEVARSYFALRTLDTELSLVEDTLGLRRENLDLVQSLFDNGQIGELDVARARTELAAAEAELLALRRQRSVFENGLAVLVGRPAPDFALSPAPLDLQPPAVAPGLPASLLERRPDVAAAERQMAAANARIGVAKTAFFPAVSLTGSAGYESAETSSLFSWDSRVWGLGPAVSLPIFEGGRNRANLKRSEAAFEEAASRYRQQLLVAFAEVEDALSALRLLDEQGQAQARAAGSARRAASLSDTRYRAGLVSYLEVVDSQRTALLAERQEAQTLGQRLQASVSLVKALGGGWREG